MWLTALPTVHRSLHVNARPFLQPVHHPFDVRILVEFQDPQFVALLAALFEHKGVVAVAGELPDQDSDFLAAPAGLGALVVAAFEAAHDVREVLLGGFVVVCTVIIEPRLWEDRYGAEGLLDICVEGWEFDRRILRLCFMLVELLGGRRLVN